MKLVKLILLLILAGCAGGSGDGVDKEGVISQISDNATFVVANELEAQLIAANFDSSLATAVKNGAIEASSQEPNDLLYVIPAAFEGAYDAITNAGLDEEQQAKAFDVIIESLLANAVGMDSTDSGAVTARIGTLSDQAQISSDADEQISVTTSNKNLRILGTAEEYSGVRGVLLADIYGVSDIDTSKAVSYQWLSDGNAISGATSKTLDMGDFFSSVQYKDITVRLTYTNTSGQQTSITSAAMPYEGFRIVANAEDGRNEWSGETASVEVNNSVNPYPLVESYSNNGTSSTSGTSAGSAHNITAVRAVDEGITAREGEKVIRIFADGSKSNRSELAHLNNETSFKSGEDYYFSGSFYASRKEWDPIVAGGSTVITQLKQYGGGDPNFELRLSNNGDYKMTWRAVPHSLSNYQEMGYAIPDAWNDVKIYAKHSRGSDGIFQVWLNSEKVIDYSGATMYRDAEGYLKFGMYTEIYDERVIYWDAIDISDHLTKDFNTWLSSGNNLPSITINGISDNQQFANSDSIVVSGTANDPSGDQLGSAGGIQSVELFAGNTRLQSTTEASFSFSGLNLSDGQHTLRVVATDTDGNEAEKTFTIWIGNRSAQVSIDASNYLLGSFNTQSSINLSTTASDPDGSIVKVEFLANGQLIGTASQGSGNQYILSWTPTTAGAYSIQARATDNQGAVTLSDSKAALVGSSITSTTLSAIQDVTIQQNSSTTGNWSETEIYGSESSPKIALVEFDLSGISSAKYIQLATFRPYVTKLQNSPGTFSIYSVGTESWSQTSINWYSKPSKGKLLDTITIGSTGSYASFDVTEALQNAIDAGQSKVTLWIEDSEQEQQRFDFVSENNGSYNKPAQLIVESATTALPDPVEGSYELNTTPDTSEPTFVSTATSSDGSKVILTYNEALSLTTASASAFDIEVDGSATSISSVATSGASVELTLSSAITFGQTIMVAYTDPTSGNDANAIQDAVGNDAASLDSTIVTNNSTPAADTVAPTFSYAVASFDGIQVFLVYDEVLSTTIAESSAFTINIEGSEANISSVETSGSAVVLTLTSIISSGQSVTVAYTDPSTSDDVNAIQDSVGNDAGSLSSTSVTNLSVAVDSDGDGVYDTWDNCPTDPNTNQFDTDGDDQGDVCDADDDADGVLDTLDNCPLEANTDQLDTDSDGRGDTCDFDDDGDWVLDQLDNCPLDVNSNQLDGDGDGQGDVCDTDLDNDNIANDVDNCPLEANTDQLDSDGDGQGNVCDSDDDGDTIVDSLDNCPLNANTSQLDSDGDGIGNVCDSDNDNDGVADSSDAFPSDPSEWVDTDSDGIGNNADSDDDNDGVLDSSDAFPLDSSESVDTDSDGVGNNADNDDDNDGVADSSDAFPLDSSESVDTDNDGIGNNADSDDDSDGVADSSDVFPLDASESVDTDSDGIGDNSDNCPSNANADQADSNGNGTGDVCETTTEKTITANRDNSVHGKSSGPDRRDEVHNYPRVEILSNGSYTVAGLFGFNLSDNITSSQTVDNATLRLTIDEIKNANSSNDYHVYGTNDDWNDNVTWNSYFSKKPNTGYSFSSLDNKSITNTTTYEFNVTSYVQTVHNAANTSISFWVEDLDNSSQTIEVQTERNSGIRAQLVLSVR